MEFDKIYKTTLYLRKPWRETQGKYGYKPEYLHGYYGPHKMVRDDIDKVMTLFIYEKEKKVNGNYKPFYFEVITNMEIPKLYEYGYGDSIDKFYGFIFANKKPSKYNIYGAPDETSIPAPIKDYPEIMIEFDKYLNENSKEAIRKRVIIAKDIALDRFHEYNILFSPVTKSSLTETESEDLKARIDSRLK